VSGRPGSGAPDLPARRWKRWGLLAFSLLWAAVFLALGVWQIERRAWKLVLIEAVEARAHAAPVPAPPPRAWQGIDAAGDAYRRVVVRGRLLNDRETLVQALTEQGGGYWVMTPLAAEGGFTVLVNRGFVPPERANPRSRAEGLTGRPVTIVGLLRVSEPKGRFLRPNQPAQERWFSRDVAAIAKARGLGPTAPYFIDAEAQPVPGGWPLGGLTVLTFPNNHLIYALTWFGLALLALTGALLVLRGERP
jgi:surfeit locus 1 family protein